MPFTLLTIQDRQRYKSKSNLCTKGVENSKAFKNVVSLYEKLICIFFFLFLVYFIWLNLKIPLFNQMLK